MALLTTFLLSVSVLAGIVLGAIAYGTAFQSDGWKRPAWAFTGAILLAYAVLVFFKLIGHLIRTL